MENLRATNESLNKKLKENEDLIKTMTTQANEESSKLKEDVINTTYFEKKANLKKCILYLSI